jgi:methylated-DNA-[protein]-cysteine S-methyltransferase
MVEWCYWKGGDGLALRLIASDHGVQAIQFHWSAPSPGVANDMSPVLVETGRQLRAYFAGTLREFSLPLDLQGSEFQLSVWRELLTIPYGETRSYQEIACLLDKPRAVRAVGAANGANPVAIVVPCHRVIGSGGSLVGYGGGLPLKKRLLELEGAPVTQQGELFSQQAQWVARGKKRVRSAGKLP